MPRTICFDLGEATASAQARLAHLRELLSAARGQPPRRSLRLYHRTPRPKPNYQTSRELPLFDQPAPRQPDTPTPCRTVARRGHE
jgi:hypothetical protein